MPSSSSRVPVEIKGYGSELGLIIQEHTAFPVIEHELRILLQKPEFRNFFAGAPVVLKNSHHWLTSEEIQKIEQILYQEGQLKLKTFVPQKPTVVETPPAQETVILRNNQESTNRVTAFAQQDSSPSLEVPQERHHATTLEKPTEPSLLEELLGRGWHAEEALVVHQTLRSGQKVHAEQTVVLIGDLNPGAEIVSTENIVVLGTIRGMVHAGAEGNQKAVIIGLSLQPTQIRIADLITQPPPGEKRPSTLSLEQAFIEDRQIIIDSYQKKRI